MLYWIELWFVDRYITDDDSEIAFKMIKTNGSNAVGQLDDVRKNPK